jgi:hypothetical protein
MAVERPTGPCNASTVEDVAAVIHSMAVMEIIRTWKRRRPGIGLRFRQ